MVLVRDEGVVFHDAMSKKSFLFGINIVGCVTIRIVRDYYPTNTNALFMHSGCNLSIGKLFAKTFKAKLCVSTVLHLSCCLEPAYSKNWYK